MISLVSLREKNITEKTLFFNKYLNRHNLNDAENINLSKTVTVHQQNTLPKLRAILQLVSAPLRYNREEIKLLLFHCR